MSNVAELDPKATIAAYSIADEKIAEWAAAYMPLTIAGVSDTAGLKAVHEARMTVKNQRVLIEKTRKELKADALEYGRKVDGEAKRLTALLEPIESHLEAEEQKVEAEKERIRQAKLAAAQARVDALSAVECQMAFAIVAAMTEEVYQSTLADANAAFAIKQEAAAAAERERIAAEEKAAADRKAEADRMAAERAELDRRQAEIDRKEKEQQAERDKLAAETRRIEEAKQADLRKAELEKARAEAAELARIETEQRLAREAEKAKRDAELAAEQAERDRLHQESLRPDREKLAAYADALESVKVPELSPAMRDALIDSNRQLAKLIAGIRKAAKVAA